VEQLSASPSLSLALHVSPFPLLSSNLPLGSSSVLYNLAALVSTRYLSGRMSSLRKLHHPTTLSRNA
jgi:hypothetical protein